MTTTPFVAWLSELYVGQSVVSALYGIDISQKHRTFSGLLRVKSLSTIHLTYFAQLSSTPVSLSKRRLCAFLVLLEIFIKTARDHSVGASACRSPNLRQRLQSHLRFDSPTHKNESAFVYWQHTSTADVLERPSLSKSDSSEDPTDYSLPRASSSTSDERTSEEVHEISLQNLFMSGMTLRQQLRESTKTAAGLWPTVASNLTIESAMSFIAIAVYSTVAWIIGASDEPTLEDCVSAPDKQHLKLLSLLEDLTYLQSSG